MPVAETQKIRIIGLKEDKEKLIRQLQESELVHLKDFQEEAIDKYFSAAIPDKQNSSSDTEERKTAEEISHIDSALSYMEQFSEDGPIVENFFPVKIETGTKEFEKTVNKFDYKKVIKNINKIKEKIAEIDEQIASLHSDISVLAPFENLSWRASDAKETQTTNSLFLRGPMEKQSALSDKLKEIDASYIEQVHSDTNSSYVFLVYWKEYAEQVLSLLKEENFETINLSYFTEIPSKAIDSSHKKISSLSREKQSLINEIRHIFKHNRNKLMMTHDWYLFRLQREQAKRNLRHSDRTFVLQGWIIKDDRDRLEEIVKKKFPASCIEGISPDKEELPPIAVRNPNIVKPFQSVTNLFGLPHFGEVDPAGLIAPFFFVFFGLCLSDVGYGIVLIGIILLAMRKIIVGKGGKQFFYLFLMCGISSILWGVVTGSWFGIDVAKLPPLLRRFMLFNPLEDLMLFFVLSLCLGIIQVFFGMFVEMYEQLRAKNFAQAFADQLSFIVILPGIILWTASGNGFLPEQFNKTGLFIMLSGGMIMVIASFFKKGRNPLLWLMLAIGSTIWKAKDFLGNVLSYSRLMALGLASCVIALVVNTTAELVLKIPYAGILFAVIILLAGHMFNMAINTLGAFVHTTRLQFVEFFSYFFQGGGEAFQPLSRESKYIVSKS